MNVLLTGACGYVGSKLLQRLIDDGHEVYGIDTQWFRSDERVAKLDLRDMPTNALPYDAVIHLAAIANDPSTDYYPRRAWETSVLATQQLAQMAARTGARFLYASSVSVYGADRGRVVETDEVRPVSDYNRAKMCAERVLLSYPEVRPQIVRPATICGLSPRMRLDLTVNLFTMQALTKGLVTVHGGQQWRPSIHIDDMVDLYVWLLNHPERTGIYNAGFENHSLLAIAKLVCEATGAKYYVTEQRDTRSYQVCSDKLLAAGFTPRKTIADAITELKEAYEAGTLRDEPQWNNLQWMRHLGIKDE